MPNHQKADLIASSITSLGKVSESVKNPGNLAETEEATR